MVQIDQIAGTQETRLSADFIDHYGHSPQTGRQLPGQRLRLGRGHIGVNQGVAGGHGMQ